MYMSGAITRSATVRHLMQGDVQFGFDLPAEVDDHLQRAAERVTCRAESLQALNDALESGPGQLEVLVALYKFHFYQGETRRARDFVFQALVKSARQGRFSYDHATLNADSTDWNDPRGPGRVFLYSLKALAFIRLRENDLEDAQSILDTLARLDPSDQVGAGVIRDLLLAMDDE